MHSYLQTYSYFNYFEKINFVNNCSQLEQIQLDQL